MIMTVKDADKPEAVGVAKSFEKLDTRFMPQEVLQSTYRSTE